MILLDLFIVMCGWVEKIVDSIEGHGLGFNIAMLRALRLVRIFRLMRLLPLGSRDLLDAGRHFGDRVTLPSGFAKLLI